MGPGLRKLLTRMRVEGSGWCSKQEGCVIDESGSSESGNPTLWRQGGISDTQEVLNTVEAYRGTVGRNHRVVVFRAVAHVNEGQSLQQRLDFSLCEQGKRTKSVFVGSCGQSPRKSFFWLVQRKGRRRASGGKTTYRNQENG